MFFFLYLVAIFMKWIYYEIEIIPVVVLMDVVLLSMGGTVLLSI